MKKKGKKVGLKKRRKCRPEFSANTFSTKRNLGEVYKMEKAKDGKPIGGNIGGGKNERREIRARSSGSGLIRKKVKRVTISA